MGGRVGVNDTLWFARIGNLIPPPISPYLPLSSPISPLTSPYLSLIYHTSSPLALSIALAMVTAFFVFDFL